MSAASLGSRAIIGKIKLGLDQAVGKSWIDRVTMHFDSDQASETYKWLGAVPQMREWIGSRHAKGFRDNGITIENKKFESTIDLLCDWIRRDKTGQVKVKIDQLVGRTVSHWNKLTSELILTGQTADCYDGFKFYAANHSEGDSGTQINLLTSSQVAALDVTTPGAPTEAEAVNAILGVIAYMLGYKDDTGEPMNENAKKFIVMTKPVLFPYLLKAITGTTEGTAVMEKMKDQGYTIEVMANARLAAYGNEFDVFRTDAPAKAVIRQEEEKVTIGAKAEGSEYEFDNDAHQYGTKAIRNVGFGFWQYAAHATLS